MLAFICYMNSKSVGVCYRDGKCIGVYLLQGSTSVGVQLLQRQ